MAKIGATIVKLALQALKSHPEGIRYSELVRMIASADPSLKDGTIEGNVWNLDEQFPDEVHKPARAFSFHL